MTQLILTVPAGETHFISAHRGRRDVCGTRWWAEGADGVRGAPEGPEMGAKMWMVFGGRPHQETLQGSS
eukprot:1153231-Pelagomonas_calceolata.AAC.11